MQSTIFAEILQYSNAISALLLDDLKELMENEVAELSTRQQMIIDLVHEQPRTINELSQFFSITTSAASQLVSNLDKQGYVKREINPVNRREVLVQLDVKGKEYIETINEIHMQVIKKYYGKLTLEEQHNFLLLHKKLYKIIVETKKG